MAVERDHPSARFNFLVELGDGSDGVVAGFSEVSGLDAEVEVIEYRTGNSRFNEPVKLVGLSRTADVTLRRGLIGYLNLWEWFEQVRNGDPSAPRTVTIHLLDEDRTDSVVTWQLIRARPIKHVSGPFPATVSDVAIEELVLSCERIEME